MAKRRCRRCPTLVPTDAYRGMCDTCRKAWDKARGTREERGYGHDHQRTRADIQTDMDRGTPYHCARCGEPIEPGQPWHLDHNADRTGYLGPSHDLCNDRAAGQASHKGTVR